MTLLALRKPAAAGITRAGRIRSSWRLALDHPLTAVPPVAEPVVQPVRPALPELHSHRDYPVPAPEVRHGHRRPLRPLVCQSLVALVQLIPGLKHGRLPAGPRAEL